MTDETYLPTLLLYAPENIAQLPRVNEDILLWANGTHANITAIRYERMDEHVPSAFGHLRSQQRYDVAENDASIKRPRVWGPYVLGVYDLANIRMSGALFVRKISDAVDENMISMLPVDRNDKIPNIQWPTNEVVLTDEPNWPERFAQWQASLVADEDASEEGEL